MNEEPQELNYRNIENIDQGTVVAGLNAALARMAADIQHRKIPGKREVVLRISGEPMFDKKTGQDLGMTTIAIKVAEKRPEMGGQVTMARHDVRPNALIFTPSSPDDANQTNVFQILESALARQGVEETPSDVPAEKARASRK